MKNILGEAIKSARIRAGYTQDQLAKEFDVTRGAVSLWEKTGKVDSKHYEKLKEMLGVTISTSIVTKDQQDMVAYTTELPAPKINLSENEGSTKLPLVDFADLEDLLLPSAYDNWSSETYSVDKKMLSKTLFGPFQDPIVLVMKGELQGLPLQDGDKMLATFYEKIFWDLTSGLFVILHESGRVTCNRIASSSDEYFFIETMPGNAHRIELPFDKVKALWTLHSLIERPVS